MAHDIDKKFLFRAIEENENITISLAETSRKSMVYTSRFFDFYRKDNTIIIDIPVGVGETYEPLVKGDKINVYFQYSGFRFYFHSKILGKLKYELNKTTKIPAYKIKLPEKLLDGERRNYFRVPTSHGNPIIAKFIVYPKGLDIVIIEPDHPDSIPKVFEGTIIDISAGGVAIKVDEGKEELKVGDKIDMKFRLKKEDFDELEISGIIRNERVYYNTDSKVFGVEFIPERSVEYKRAINKISRYVIERQRELLS